MQLKVVYFQVCLVDLSEHIQCRVYIYSTLSFSQFQIGLICRTVYINLRNQVHTIGNYNSPIGSLTGQSSQEVQILGGHLQPDRSRARDTVRQIFKKPTTL